MSKKKISVSKLASSGIGLDDDFFKPVSISSSGADPIIDTPS